MPAVIQKDNWDTLEQYLEYLRHFAAYELFAEPVVAEKNVLEIGCGNGYGAACLAKSARSVTAVDISFERIQSCSGKYHDDNLFFKQASGSILPFEADSFDIVLSFQVIEHLGKKDLKKYLSEIKRVLKSGGTFLITTPNSRLRLLPFEKPWNPEHAREYNRDELSRLLRGFFKNVEVSGLCGSESVKSTGYGIIRHSPLQAYVTLPVQRALRKILPGNIKTGLKKVIGKQIPSSKKTPPERYKDSYSVNDFTVNSSASDDCYDLLGTCLK